MSIPQAPTYADLMLIDPHTKKPTFNPTWLDWFLMLAQAQNANVVTRLAVSGSPFVSGDVTLAPGVNVSMTEVGSLITVASTGISNVMGLPLPILVLEGEEGPEGMMIPGQVGPAGAPGSAGAAGQPGIPGFGIDGQDGEEGMPIPGQQGAAGTNGTNGTNGIAGSIGMMGMDGDEGPEGMPIPGNVSSYVAGLLGISSGLTDNTTINDTVTYTTGGVTLTNQVAANTTMWRVCAQGTFVAVSSATARNAQIAPYWGSTALPGIAVVVLASVAQTTNWYAEFTIVGSSTTAVWTTGMLQNKFDYPAIVVNTSSADKTDFATPASTTVTAGAQTLDLRFSMSVAVATDQWVVQSVTMERLK